MCSKSCMIYLAKSPSTIKFMFKCRETVRVLDFLWEIIQSRITDGKIDW